MYNFNFYQKKMCITLIFNMQLQNQNQEIGWSNNIDIWRIDM